MASAAKEAAPAVNGSEVASSVNGNIANGNHVNYKSPPPAKGSKSRPSGFQADRQGVTQAFAQFAQLIQASRRPLPTQTGDSTFGTVQKKSGLRNDLKYIGWKGINRNSVLSLGPLLTLQM